MQGAAPVTTAAADRSRTFTWTDPAITVAAARSMSGLELMSALVRGELPRPPVADLVDFDLAKVAEGEVEFQFEPREFHYNPIGTVHGGIIATLLDSALGCCVHTTVPAGGGYTTLEIKVNYVKAVLAATGRMHCTARVIHRGRRVATAEAWLRAADGALYAHGSTTCMIF
jgi:uncharacterized protein (TIGR00369 family)